MRSCIHHVAVVRKEHIVMTWNLDPWGVLIDNITQAPTKLINFSIPTGASVSISFQKQQVQALTPVWLKPTCDNDMQQMLLRTGASFRLPMD